jgi:hypothetical protein
MSPIPRYSLLFFVSLSSSCLFFLCYLCSLNEGVLCSYLCVGDWGNGSWGLFRSMRMYGAIYWENCRTTDRHWLMVGGQLIDLCLFHDNSSFYIINYSLILFMHSLVSTLLIILHRRNASAKRSRIKNDGCCTHGILRRNCQATSAPMFYYQIHRAEGRYAPSVICPCPILRCQNPPQPMNNSKNKTVTFVSTQVLSILHLYICFQAPPIPSHDYRFE